MNRKLNMKIYFENEQDKLPITYRMKMLVRNAIEATLDYEQYGNPCEVSVTFTDNESIRKLNRKFRGINRATDVLSFPLFEEGADGTRELGDVVLSLERCRAQAEEFGHSFERECAFLTVHSTLHLLGYDHVNGEEEEQDMRNRQTAIVEQMGYGIKEEEK